MHFGQQSRSIFKEGVHGSNTVTNGWALPPSCNAPIAVPCHVCSPLPQSTAASLSPHQCYCRVLTSTSITVSMGFVAAPLELMSVTGVPSTSRKPAQRFRIGMREVAGSLFRMDQRQLTEQRVARLQRAWR